MVFPRFGVFHVEVSYALFFCFIYQFFFVVYLVDPDSVHIARDQRLKLDNKTKPCIFLGYLEDEFGYRL